MKLHHAGTKPDWDLVAASKRNSWQRLAKLSYGVMTPGNLLSFIGILLVGIGLAAINRQHIWKGLVLLAMGRLCDILDGSAAEYTGTKSPLGEAVDASLDKIAA